MQKKSRITKTKREWGGVGVTGGGEAKQGF